ncbi:MULTISPECIES: DUF4427 domain-containing protein [unclassified Janthinobacterium]|uniref:DUF4427 domain-containing protein n=1 Tax=unclassified Janthinobacterium TaxID=2610881 RepID=UPI00161B34D8|nr:MULTISPECIES: DUF4427 domain-containing protein [unclassified Janthinobacterium]MBB5610758.1 hypothetical protein [Janthinobacterium sp. S3T4]MBB5616244.1 hypothetical protein [Janthinobacterium sp. S3M3]
MKNNYRFDLSDYLIHFFRDIDLEGPNSIEMPEHMGWHSLYEDTYLPAIFMLRAALRNGRLWATWSYRNNVRTIYGPNPAVCFTDMPIAAFVESSQLRHARGEAMGEVALVFPKENMRRLGARKVIYGLSEEPTIWPRTAFDGSRTFSDQELSLAEQYRYVPDVSSEKIKIDWTHECEWRWPFKGKVTASEIVRHVSDWSDIPGLDFYLERISGISAIVKTHEQGLLVAGDMLALVDAGIADKQTFDFILVTENLASVKNIRDRGNLSSVIQCATIDLDQYFTIKSDVIYRVTAWFDNEVSKIEKWAGRDEYGEFGGCWLWLHDGTNLFVRCLLKEERIFVTKDGRYLANLYGFSDGKSLRQRQKMTGNLAQRVKEQFDLDCCYFSVVNSDDADSGPFYAGIDDDDIPFFNNTWNYR